MWWTVSKKLGLLTITSVVGLVAMIGIAQHNTDLVFEKTNVANTNGLPSLIVLDELRRDVLLMRLRLNQRILYDGTNQEVLLMEQFAQHQRGVTMALQRYESNACAGLSCVNDEADRYYLDEEKQIWSHYKVMVDTVIEAIHRDKLAQAKETVAKSQEMARGFDDAIDQHIKYNAALSQKSAFEAVAVKEAALHQQLGLCLTLLLLLGVSSVLVSRSLLRQLGGEPSTAAAIAEHLAAGDLSVAIPLKPGDRTSVMAQIKATCDTLERLGVRADAVSQGNLTDDVPLASGKDRLGHAISSMVRILRSGKDEDARRNWLKDGYTQLSASLTGDMGIQQVGDTAISLLGRYLRAGRGAVFLYLAPSQQLELIGSYMFCEPAQIGQRFAVGIGTIGQVARERKPLTLSIGDGGMGESEETPHVDAVITATASVPPRHTYTYPLIHEGELMGVVELASMEPFGEQRLQFLNNASTMLAAYLYVARQRASIQSMLAESEETTREMVRQSQQLSASMREAKEAQAQIESVFDGASNGIFLADPAGKLLRVNASLANMLGVVGTDLVGTQLTDVTHSDDLSAEQALLAELHSGLRNSYRLEKRFTRAGSAPLWVDVAVSAIRDDSVDDGISTHAGHLVNLVGVVVDVTEQRQMQEALSRAKAAAEEASAAKGNFLANMSHEIRTPMNAILGMSYLALQQKMGDQPRNYIEKVHSSAKGLLGIINDILDFSKIEAGKMSMERTDFQLEAVMDHLSNLVGIKAAEKGLELHFKMAPDLPSDLVGDPLRLGQILVNLGNNAVKFTERGNVVVSAQVKEREADAVTLQFSVQDDGIGMTPEQVGALFQSFSQADASTSRKYGGTGLGLVISKNLIEMMGGTVWVDSQSGVGTTFNFTARFGLGVAAPMAMPSLEEIKGLHALIVDDNAMAREILSAALHSFGLRCETAVNGNDAVRRFSAAHQNDQAYDLILMDWRMPGMDGIACLQAMAKITPKLPATIFVSANGLDDAKAEVQRSGVTVHAYLSKPTTPSVVLETLGAALRLGSLRHAKPAKNTVTPSADALDILKGTRVLLVDDNAMNQELATALLTQAGVDYEVADNGQIAVDMLKARAVDFFDAVLMDCQMPVMDGYTATRLIRADGRWSGLPILAMTANAMSGDREKVLSVGMNDHISKPIDVDTMYITMARWIQPRRAQLPVKAPAPQSAPQSTPTSTPTSAEPNHAGLPALPGLEPKLGLARVAGNAELYQRMLNRFTSTYGNLDEQLRQAMSAQDPMALQRFAHTLKGLAGTIGAPDVEAAAADLEAASETAHDRGHSLEPMDPTLNRLREAMAVLLPSIEQFKPTRPAPAPRPPLWSRAELRASIAKLAPLIDDCDGRASEFGDVIVEQTKGSPLATRAQALANALSSFEFDLARQELSVVCEALDAEVP